MGQEGDCDEDEHLDGLMGWPAKCLFMVVVTQVFAIE